MHIVDRMLELAEIKKTDMLYDMGTGDGRIVLKQPSIRSESDGIDMNGYEC